MQPDVITNSGSYLDIIKMMLDLGPVGLMMVMWWFGKQQTDKMLTAYQTDMQKMLSTYQADTQAILKQYREDMLDHKTMYANNIEFIKRYEALASDLKEVIMLVTQNLTQLTESIKRGDCR